MEHEVNSYLNELHVSGVILMAPPTVCDMNYNGTYRNYIDNVDINLINCAKSVQKEAKTLRPPSKFVDARQTTTPHNKYTHNKSSFSKSDLP